MVGIDPCVDNGYSDAFSRSDCMYVLDIEEFQMPLRVADRVVYWRRFVIIASVISPTTTVRTEVIDQCLSRRVRGRA